MMSLFYNSIFAIELLLNQIINPKNFFLSIWNMVSLIIILSSILSVVFEFYTNRDEFYFLKSLFLALQLLRFGLLIKDVLLLKKFFRTLKIIFLKSTSFFSLFFIIWFAYAIIGISIF